MPARRDGLFQRGVSPSENMRAKLREAQRRRRIELHAEDQRAIDEFVAKVQVMLDEIYRRLELQ